MTYVIDDDLLAASVDLIGRAGARELEFGYLEDDVPIEKADWWATATYKGAKVTEEHHRGPYEAVDALARRLLTGAKCKHCNKLVTLTDLGVVALPGATLTDGSVLPTSKEELRAMGFVPVASLG